MKFSTKPCMRKLKVPDKEIVGVGAVEYLLKETAGMAERCPRKRLSVPKAADLDEWSYLAR